MHEIHNDGWQRHRTMRNPMADVGRFMQGCAGDPVTRVMGTTALVLALCQAAGPAMISQPPGFILVNAGEEPADPIDAVMQSLTGLTRPGPRPKPEQFERNRQTMKALLVQKKSEAPRANPVLDCLGLPESGECCPLAAKFHNAMMDNHGRGRAGWYADRRDEEFGWFTDASGHSILRLDRADDRRQLKEDLRLRPQWLIHPLGYGSRMREEAKRLSIAGSLPVADWDDHVVDSIVHNAIPVLFLPHTASEPLVTPGDLALEWIGIALASEAEGSQATPAEPYQRLDLIKPPWVKERLARLRGRLRHFPSDYEFFVTRSLRELLPCCRRLVGITAPGGTPEAGQCDLTFDLFNMVLQGVCLGVESLGWYGYGFASPGGREPMQRALRAIRERGSISRRELLRNQQWLKAERRDAIIAVLEHEGLVLTTDNELTAAPFTDYWRSIIHRSSGEMPEPSWKGYVGRQEAVACN